MLRDITYWVLDVLENAGLHASLTAGALLGVVRDGGVLISADTDVDIAVCPEDKDKVGNNTAPAAAASHAQWSRASRPLGLLTRQVFKALKAARRPRLVAGVEYSPNQENINVLYAAPPSGAPVASAAHVEVYFHLKRSLWPG